MEFITKTKQTLSAEATQLAGDIQQLKDEVLEAGGQVPLSSSESDSDCSSDSLDVHIEGLEPYIGDITHGKARLQHNVTSELQVASHKKLTTAEHISEVDQLTKDLWNTRNAHRHRHAGVATDSLQSFAQISLEEDADRSEGLKVTEPDTRMDYLDDYTRASETLSSNGNWEKLTVIGDDAFGHIYKGFYVNTGKIIAIKEMSDMRVNEAVTIIELMTKMISKVMSMGNYDCILQYYGIQIEQSKTIVFMEYCDGPLLSSVAKEGISERMIRVCTKQMLQAIELLHRNGIVHRNISAHRFFLSKDGCIKLFGLEDAILMQDIDKKLPSMTGRADYASPEKLEGHTGQAGDIWGLGCTVIILTGHGMWKSMDNMYQIMFHVGGGGMPNIPAQLCPAARSFVRHCLEPDHCKRWTASRLQQHPFIATGVSSLRIMCLQSVAVEFSVIPNSLLRSLPHTLYEELKYYLTDEELRGISRS